MRNHPSLPGWRPAVLATAGCLLFAPTQAFAGAYWSGFSKYWSSFVNNTDGVVITALAIGVIALFIITRGKWNKT